MNGQIGQSTSNASRRKLIISRIFNKIYHLDHPIYVLIAKNVELELGPVTPNPTVIGQFYKYMSFFQVYLFI